MSQGAINLRAKSPDVLRLENVHAKFSQSVTFAVKRLGILKAIKQYDIFKRTERVGVTCSNDLMPVP